MRTECRRDRRDRLDQIDIDLEGCLVQAEASKAWFARRVLPLTVEQVRWRPSPRSWSIAECLHHLNLTIEFYLPGIDRAIALGRRHNGASNQLDRYSFEEIRALQQVEPPVTAPMAAAGAVLPAVGVELDQLVEQFYATREQYADAVRGSSGLDLPGVRIAEPLVPGIRTLGATLAFIAAHDRRHMWQAERIRHAARFPNCAFRAPV